MLAERSSRDAAPPLVLPWLRTTDAQPLPPALAAASAVPVPEATGPGGPGDVGVSTITDLAGRWARKQRPCPPNRLHHAYTTESDS